MAVSKKVTRRKASAKFRKDWTLRKHRGLKQMLSLKRNTYRRVVRGAWRLSVSRHGISVKHRGQRIFIPHGMPEMSSVD